MFEFKITVDVNVPSELIAALNNFASALAVSGTTHLAGAAAHTAAAQETTAVANGGQADTQPETPQPEKTKRRQSSKSQPEEPKAPEPEESEDPTPNEPDDQPVAPPADVPSVVDLRSRAQEVGSTAEGRKAVKDLIIKYGAKSISEIPEDKRADFLAELDLV